jgi:hypothetical protein
LASNSSYFLNISKLSLRVAFSNSAKGKFNSRHAARRFLKRIQDRFDDLKLLSVENYQRLINMYLGLEMAK